MFNLRKRLKICFTTNSSPWTRFHGGGQIFVHNLAKNLSKRGHNVTVLYSGPLCRPPKKSLRCKYKVEWAYFVGYPYTGKLQQLNLITVYNKLRYLHETNRFDIINAVGSEAFFIPQLCRKYNTPFFVSIEHPNLSSLQVKFDYAHLVQSVVDLVRMRELALIKSACLKANGICTPSRFTKLEAVKNFHIKANKIRVINHGIIDSMLTMNDNKTQHSSSGPLVYFGRFEPQKGVDLLIDSYSRLVKRNIIDAQELILIGSGPDEKKYRAMVKALGLNNKVIFLGWKSASHIRACLNKASLCILPSRSESFGLTVAETLAQGVPLVTTNAGSIPEVIDNGGAAWMAEKNSLESLMNTIQRAIENYPESLRKSKYGKKHARDSFSWEKAAKEYEDFYRSVLESQTEN